MVELLQDDPSVTELTLTQPIEQYESGCISDWVATFAHNHHITNIRIEGDFLQSVSEEDGQLLLSHLGEFPSLKQVHIRHGNLSAKALTKLVQDAQNLAIFELNHVTLYGNDSDMEHDDFCDLQFAFYKHPCLTDFIWTDVDIRTGDGTTGDDEDAKKRAGRGLESIIKSLCSMPNLAVLRMQPHRDSACMFSGSGLAPLCKSLSLRELSLDHFKLEKLHYGMIAWAMCKTPLQKLSLTYTGMNDEAAAKIAASLASESCSLDFLDLSFNDIGDDSCQSLADGLLNNKKLKVLRLDGCKSIGPTGLAKLAALLEQNDSMQQLVTPLNGGGSSDQMCRAKNNGSANQKSVDRSRALAA